MCANRNECLRLNPSTAHFQQELSLDQLNNSNEFTCRPTGGSGDTLTCDLSLCREIRCNRQYKARRCPLSFGSYNDQTLYLQQHQHSSVKLSTPTLPELGIEATNNTQLEFKQVVPIARHVQDYHLLQFKLQPRCTKEDDNVFMSINPVGGETCVFKVSTVPGLFLDVLACSMAMKEEPLLACLFSYNEEFQRSNALSIEIFQEDSSPTTTLCSKVPWLSRIHRVSVYLYCLPSVLLPVILHHPRGEDTLVCFNINGEPPLDNQKCTSSSGISELKWKAESCSQKMNLFALLGCMSVNRTKFLNAQFSPDGHVLVVSCSTTNTSWTSRTAAYILFNSVTYEMLSTISVGLYREPETASSQFNRSSLVCCKSYCPLFSGCGTKLGLISSPYHENVEDKRVVVQVYTIPVLMTLQSQCRIMVRKCVKEQDISKLKLPPLLLRYLYFQ